MAFRAGATNGVHVPAEVLPDSNVPAFGRSMLRRLDHLEDLQARRWSARAF